MDGKQGGRPFLERSRRRWVWLNCLEVTESLQKWMRADLSPLYQLYHYSSCQYEFLTYGLLMGSWKQGWSGPGEILCEIPCPKAGLFLAEVCLTCSVTVSWVCPKELFFWITDKTARTGAAITSHWESKCLRASSGMFLIVVRVGAVGAVGE